jgi:arylsulfatase A-like enzyme
VASVEEMRSRLPTVGVDDLAGRPMAHRWWKLLQSAQMGSIDSMEGYHQVLDNYLFMMQQVDAQLWRVITQAIATSAAQGRELYIVFTSDHGENLGEHSLTSKGPEVYRGSKNVPLVVVHVLADGSIDPATAGRRSDALTSSVDLVPTFLDLAGLPASADLKGRSLRPLLADPSSPGPRSDRGVLFTYDQSAIQPDLWPDHYGPGMAGLKVYHRGFLAPVAHRGETRLVKYAGYFNPGHQDDPAELHERELYLVDVDPMERADLATSADHQDLLDRCHSHLMDLIGEEGARVYDGDPTGSNNTPAVHLTTG